MIHLSAVQKLGAETVSSLQSAHQADGSSPVKLMGETRIALTHDKHMFHFEGLVMENIDGCLRDHREGGGGVGEHLPTQYF